MRQQCDFDTAGVSLNAWRQDTPDSSNADEQIDLDRVVWDPEYRDQVLENMKMTG